MTTASSRAAFLEEVHNSRDIDRFIKLFADNVKLSDYVLDIVDFPKQGIRDFYSGFWSGNGDVTFRTRHAYGSDDLFAWEVDLIFIAGGDIDKIGVKKGQNVVMKGVSLQRWENNQIIEQKDYFFVDSAK